MFRGRGARRLDLVAGKFLDVHVLERQDLHARYESALAVHVPHPCVGQLHFDERTGAVGRNTRDNLVREIETAFRFDRKTEHGHDVLIFLGELQFALGLEIFEIVGVQRGPDVRR
jgi:hypothetical protein